VPSIFTKFESLATLSHQDAGVPSLTSASGVLPTQPPQCPWRPSGVSSLNSALGVLLHSHHGVRGGPQGFPAQLQILNHCFVFSPFFYVLTTVGWTDRYQLFERLGQYQDFSPRVFNHRRGQIANLPANQAPIRDQKGVGGGGKSPPQCSTSHHPPRKILLEGYSSLSEEQESFNSCKHNLSSSMR
jgi:hypothetical protein